MGREIKFKAWDGKKMYTPFDMVEYLQTNWMPWEPFMPDNIFLQFTGLKDKNGKEIYEGDILKTDSAAFMKVEYREDMAMFVCRFNTGASTNIFHSWEVIGNIYENPELLNV